MVHNAMSWTYVCSGYVNVPVGRNEVERQGAIGSHEGDEKVTEKLHLCVGGIRVL